ncbi:MAG: phage tail sheath C-terminal domain-containing protein [Bacteroidota bacterium]
MANTYNTPGAFVEEISTLPASIAPVATAIPAFVGYTALHAANVPALQPTRITSLGEYETIFGGPGPNFIRMTVSDAFVPQKTDVFPSNLLYYSLRFYFANGGGPCWVVSVGPHGAVSGPDLIAGVQKLEEVDEPTLVVVPDGIILPDAATLGTVHVAMLDLAAKTQDRFALLDVIYSDGTAVATTMSDFRTAVGNLNLKYGAAYYPPVRTTLNVEGPVTIADFSDINGTPGLTYLETNAPVTGDEVLIAYWEASRDLTLLGNAQTVTDPSFVPPSASALTKAFAAIESDWTTNYNPALTATTFGSDAPAVAYLQGLFLTLIQLGDLLYSYIPVSGDYFETDSLEALRFSILKDGTVATPAPTPLMNQMQLLHRWDLGYKDVEDSGNAPLTAGVLGVARHYDTNSANEDRFVSPGYDYNLKADFDTYVTGATAVPEHVVYYDGATQPADLPEAVFNINDDLKAMWDTLKGYYDSLVADANLYHVESDLYTASSTVVALMDAIRSTGLYLPVSSAVAGAYATVDRNRGVWKAPANVSLHQVERPYTKLKDEEQAGMNVDASGKSVNAIRQFRGKGTLIWGARTLDGNSNEWRYVPVRRLYNFIEESIAKSTEFVVFEPNDANTWTKVRAMIENFLTGLWREGALAGATPQEGFFVNVGLGETMDSDDVLNGRLIIEIGLAAVRPAEFIILKFSHKIQS